MNLDEHGNDRDHPLYGGNKIPQWYLDRFRSPTPEHLAEMPAWMAKEVANLFG